MIICCPKCNSIIDNANINVTENVCVCSICNEVFNLSALLDKENIEEAENVLENPPKGILVTGNYEHIKIKIPTHSPEAIFLFFFTLGFSSVSFMGFYEMITSKSTIGLLFMSVFLAASVFLWTHLLYALFGKIMIVINTNKNSQDYIFIGIGIIGRKHNINFSKSLNIYEHIHHDSEGGTDKKIYITEKNKIIKIPAAYFNENKKKFLLMVLKYFRDINRKILL
jgi:hypothetical protein